MSRPVGDPGALAAGARSMAAATAALQELRDRLRGASSSPVATGAWKGPASEAFTVAAAAPQTGLDRAAEALTQAAGALSELAARLAGAQATWDRAQRLAATVGVELHPLGDDTPATGTVPGGAGGPAGLAEPAGSGGLGMVRLPTGGLLGAGIDGSEAVALAVVGQAVRMAVAANHEAAAARRAAAARLDHAAALAASPGARLAGPAGPVRATSPLHDPVPGGPAPGGPAGDDDAQDYGPGPGEPGHGAGSGHAGEGHGWRGVAGRVLETGAEVVTATHHLAAGAAERLRAASRLATTADDPAVRAAAARVVDGAGRPVLSGRALHALPVVAPVLDFAAGVSEGEPVPRALTGAIGGAIGADLGGRVGLAVCGGQAAATQGAGVVVCPALTAVGGAVGAYAGKQAALNLYDKLAAPDPPPRSRSSP